MMLVGTNAFAQFSIGAGYAYGKTNLSANLLGLSFEKTAGLSGFYAGGSYNLPIGTSGLGIAPGLYFSYLTDKDADLYVQEGELDEMYVQLPLDLNFKLPIVDGANLVVYAGPTLSYGVSSKIRSGDNKIDLYDGTIASVLDYKPFDVLVGGGVGLEIDDIVRFTVGYDAGLLNRGGSNVEVRRNQLTAGVSLLF